MTALLSALNNFRPGRLAVALFAVPAILIGLLGMHVLTTGSTSEAQDHHSSVMLASTVASDVAMVLSPGTASQIDTCGTACMPSHDMLGMMCVLALLAGAILLHLQFVLTGWPGFTRILGAAQLKAASVAPPAPPSLHVLSISRT